MALSLALKTEAGRSLSSRPGLQRVQSRDYTEKPYLEKKKKEKKKKKKSSQGSSTTVLKPEEVQEPRGAFASVPSH